jgi:hypothetical protein
MAANYALAGLAAPVHFVARLQQSTIESWIACDASKVERRHSPEKDASAWEDDLL